MFSLEFNIIFSEDNSQVDGKNIQSIGDKMENSGVVAQNVYGNAQVQSKCNFCCSLQI